MYLKDYEPSGVLLMKVSLAVSLMFVAGLNSHLKMQGSGSQQVALMSSLYWRTNANVSIINN
jgi:hypothetical protein